MSSPAKATPSVPEQPSNATSRLGTGKLVLICWLLAGAVGLLASRIPLQEDVYILLRHAVNLAQHHEYTYNLGKVDVGVTCHLYAFYLTLINVFVPSTNAFILAIKIGNTLLLTVSMLLFAKVIFGPGAARFVPCFIVSPFFLLTAANGMETSMLLMLLAVLFYSARTNPRLSFLCAGLLPWVRPEYCVLSAVLMLIWFLPDKRKSLTGLAAVLIGSASLLIFNKLLTGNCVNQPILGKALHHIPNDPHSVCTRLLDVYIVKNLYLPVGRNSHKLMGIGYSLLFYPAVAFGIWRHRRERTAWALLAVVGYPIIYVVTGGNPYSFPWYYLTGQLLSLMFLFLVFRSWLTGPRLVALGTALALASGLVATNNIFFRRDKLSIETGQFLKKIARPGDSIILEPAGIIPYYTGLVSYEAVGLASTDVYRYGVKYGHATWMLKFLEDYKPTFIWSRTKIENGDLEGVGPLTPTEQKWLLDSYVLIEEKHYHPSRKYYEGNALLKKLSRISRFDSFESYVYQRIDARNSNSPPALITR